MPYKKDHTEPVRVHRAIKIKLYILMRRLLPFIVILTMFSNMMAQDIPMGFNYQAVLRDASDNIIANQEITLELSIEDAAGSDIWIETHTVTTNQFGLVSLVVGQGTRTGGSATGFSDIDWGSGTKKLHTVITYNSQDIDMGSSDIWSIPYSLTSGNASYAQEAARANIAYDLAGDLSKLNVVEDIDGVGEEPLFEVKNNTGQTVFAVYNEGVEVYVNDTGTKGVKGGFAVKGFDEGKGSASSYLIINSDSARIYIDSDVTKGNKGGFAVGSFSGPETKTIGEEYLRITRDSARIYIDSDATKGNKGGFAVGSFSGIGTKTTGEEYLRITRDSTRIYINDSGDGLKGEKGSFAVKGFETGTGKSDISSYFDINLNSANLLVTPAENRILWYPYSNAFLTGRVLIDDAANVGENSFVSGYESRAKGDYSQAMGYKAYADGLNSTSIGQNSMAGGDNSYAIGQNAQAMATESYAIGNGASVYEEGLYSYALGTGAEALDLSGYAIGTGAVSSGESSVAIGTSSYADGDYSYAFGIDAYTGPYGDHAFAIGPSTRALGEASYAIGYGSNANAISSFALGHEAEANGEESYAIGKAAIADANESYAIGRGAIANGIGSFAFGSAGLDSLGQITQVVTATGPYSVAIGQGAQTVAEGSVAIGISTTASGKFATAMGYETISSGYSSFASGSKTNASDNYSTAMGYYSTASGLGSTAIGYRTSATASYSLAAGYGNKANGRASVALGTFSTASGVSSIAAGTHVTAPSYGETALGMFNTPYTPAETEYPGDASDRLLVVGNGSKESPSDAMVILKNGSIGIGTSSPNIENKLHVIGTNAGANNISVYTQASGGSDNYGIRTEATGTGTTNYGIYATAYGATNNYAGYFGGDVTVNGVIRPGINGFFSLGDATWRWSTIYATNGTIETSDARYKTDIEAIENSLDKIMHINGVRYNWRTDEFPEMNFDANAHIGVLAQEVEEVLPELVYTDENGYKSISYEKLTPVLIEAVKEQQGEIESLKTENEELKNRLTAIEKMLKL